MTISVNEIDVEIIKKNIKNVHLVVLPPNGKVRVSAPLNMSDDAIRVMIVKKLNWIRAQKISFSNQQRQTKRQYVSGESIQVWGKRYLLKVKHAEINKIELNNNIFTLFVKKDSTTEAKEKIINKWYRKQLKNLLTTYIEKWEKLTDLHANKYVVKYMKTKWGSCNHEKKYITLNLQLAKKIPECLDYIVLHEITHLKERTHGKSFVSFLDKHMKNWREIKKSLNDEILDFYEED